MLNMFVCREVEHEEALGSVLVIPVTLGHCVMTVSMDILKV